MRSFPGCHSMRRGKVPWESFERAAVSCRLEVHFVGKVAPPWRPTSSGAPTIPATAKHLRLPLTVVAKFEKGEIAGAREH